MIATISQEPRYQIKFTNGTQQSHADVLPVKGGQGAGFGPHELLEASLACCINMWIRMKADQLGIPVGEIGVTVVLRREHPESAIFEHDIKIEGALTENQHATLMREADDCPVRRTLLKKLSFQPRAG
jgi:putative redox protein